MPPHLAIIFSNHVRLHGDVEHLWEGMRMAGYGDRLFVDDFGYAAIRFEEGIPHEKNISLLTLLFLLNDLGVHFAEDHKQLWSPAEFMHQLQRDLVLRKPFTSVGLRNREPEEWISTLHKPVVP